MSDHSTQSQDRRALRLDPSPRGSPDFAPGAPVTGPHLNAQKAAINAPEAINCFFCGREHSDDGLRTVIGCECGNNIIVVHDTGLYDLWKSDAPR